MIIGLGNYSGGELLFNDLDIKIDIKNNPYFFKGDKLKHSTLDFIGDRYTIMYFNYGFNPIIRNDVKSDSLTLKEIKNGWKINIEDEIRAKEAIAKAISEMPNATSEIAEGSIKVKKVPKTPKVPKVPKVVKEKMQPISEPIVTNKPEFVESINPPISVTDTIVVKVKKIKYQNKDYYFDSKSGKAYAVSSSGVGAYSGRYNPETQELNKEYPDSDNE
jgi:hypothetical protein